eukprot:7091013-Lingulodinium_polyedra.AAC.1
MALPGGAGQQTDPEEKLPGAPATEEEMPLHCGPARFFRRVVQNNWPQHWCALCKKAASEERVRASKHINK